MGEYFQAVNHNRRERFSNHACGGCVKFSENMGGHAGQALWYLMHHRNVDGSDIVGRWGGDNVEIIGDEGDVRIDDRAISYSDIGELVNDWLKDNWIHVGDYEGHDYDDYGERIPLKFKGRDSEHRKRREEAED